MSTSLIFIVLITYILFMILITCIALWIVEVILYFAEWINGEVVEIFKRAKNMVKG